MDKAGGNSGQSETLYDILKVPSDCSDKEIRSAYVQLSKKFHPDVKGGGKTNDQHADFLKISEAYQTLRTPKTRREYDELLKASKNMRIIEMGNSAKTIYHRPWEIKPNYDPNPGPYYGINGFNRTTNSKVAAAIILLGIAGGIFGFFSVKHSFTLNQKRLDEVSAKASEHHQRIRAQVHNSTREENLRRLVERMTNRNDR
ncbi:dnaJ-like protein 60 [Stomoxys calcitrans]|uniref:J domain-containing protein n=1 Tax=Stomoxys calcitrans TaxID=35570 RepID=A0A1I8P2Y0_STOCA|nr:dnaJ-like protein 60 [Stomoxys calcitrans]